MAFIPPPDPYFAMERGRYDSLLGKATPAAWDAYQEHRAALSRRVPPEREDIGYEVVDGIAVIPFKGLVEREESFYGWLWGCCASTERLIQTTQRVKQDGSVREAVLDVYSPGGSIYGVWDAARAVADLDVVKPVTTWGGDIIASAAFWIGAMGRRLLVNATCFAGSIGVYTTHHDYTRMLRNFGIESKTFASGPFKGAGSPGVPLTAEQEEEIQATIDTLKTEFVADACIKARRLSVERAAAASDGRCFLPREAMQLGLVDGVTTLSALLGSLRAAAPVIPDPAYVEPSDPPGEDCPGSARGTAHAYQLISQETGRDPSAPIDPSSSAGARAPKENDMDEAAVKALLAETLAPVTKQLAEANTKIDAQAAEIAGYKAKLDGTSDVVTGIQADRGLERLLLTARGEFGGPVLIASSGDLAEAQVTAITALYAKSPKEADAYISQLKPIGKGTGSVIRGTAPHPATFAPSAKVSAFPFDPYKGSWATSNDPVMQRFGQKVQWGADQMAAGVKFRNSAEWLLAFDSAHPN